MSFPAILGDLDWKISLSSNHGWRHLRSLLRFFFLWEKSRIIFKKLNRTLRLWYVKSLDACVA